VALGVSSNRARWKRETGLSGLNATAFSNADRAFSTSYFRA
jgi:hypothetical protein